MVAYHPHSDNFLRDNRRGQYAELYAALKQDDLGECILIYILYTDSWSVANGLATWLPTWVAKDWKIHAKEVWGNNYGQEKWEYAPATAI